MPSTIAANIKAAILGKLTALVPTTLALVQEDDLRVPIFQRILSAYPAAILTCPATTSVIEDRDTNMRTYTYEIIVMQKPDNLVTAHDIEDLQETILTAFDNDPTLGGISNGAVDPAASRPEPITILGSNMIVFGIQISAKALIPLTIS